jgi:hypothetical protein
MSGDRYNDPELRAQLEARMFRVQDSHEAAIVLRNELARLVPGRIITNRHPGSDHFHIEMDQDVAAALLDLIRPAWREDADAQPPPLSPTRPTA